MTVAHTTALLKELDEHIQAARQQIATLQVEIARLEDTRVTLMRLEERKAYFAGQPSPYGDLGGGAIIMRDPALRPGLAHLPDGALSLAAKTGQPIAAIAASDGLQAPAVQSWQQKPRRLQRKPRPSKYDMRRKVLHVLKDVPEGMTSVEIGGYLGIPSLNEARKPLQNALYNMRIAKLVELRAGQFPGKGRRQDIHVYSLTELGKQQLATWGAKP